MGVIYSVVLVLRCCRTIVVVPKERDQLIYKVQGMDIHCKASSTNSSPVPTTREVTV